MRGTEGCNPARGSESQKAALSSDRGLQLDLVKSESLVIADQQRCGEYVPDGHPMLTPAAIDAVRQWRYKPYFLNGEPVEVDTQITVNFTLAGG